jgi:hypothetical protein
MSALRLLRLLPVLSSSSSLQFALDEHLIFGTWVDPSLQKCANEHLPAWWTRGGLRWRWIIILGYPVTYVLAIMNMLIAAEELRETGAYRWYLLGLLFSMGHMGFVTMALQRIADIENDVPKGKSTESMKKWLKMNWVRAIITDTPAWVCFIVAVLKAS